MLLLSPDNFPDYELIDCGNFLKLERFGKYITIRPEPQALWSPAFSATEWTKRAHVEFVPKSSSSGVWRKLKEMPDRWMLKAEIGNQVSGVKTLMFRLSLTSFKHVGVFPEQWVNWNYIYNNISELKKSGVELPKVLNLFAYTGGASLAAKTAGADVTHLDSIKQVVSWAKENMELSSLDNIRWVVEDALTFVKREAKRGKKYNGVILDPPAYGHGTNGEKWKLEGMINEMIAQITKLADEKFFLVLNTYSLGFSSLIIENLLNEHFAKHRKKETGEIFLKSTTGKALPLGVFGRVGV